MKIVYTYYEDSTIDISKIKQIIENHLSDVEFISYLYKDKKEFIDIIKDADAIMTAFVMIDKEVIDNAKKLKCVSFISTGYNFIDLKYATLKNIAVFYIGEYCTKEVAEHTLALILALSKNIKYYSNNIDSKNVWRGVLPPAPKPLYQQTLAVFGFGKIGRLVCSLAKAIGINVVVYNSHVDKTVADKLKVKVVDIDYIYKNADIVSNHMKQTSENFKFFNKDFFSKLQNMPIFINVSRGDSLDELALIHALDNKLVSKAGLDVLSSESPDLKNNVLVNRTDVIITPHIAFYSQKTMNDLINIPCENVINYFNKQYLKLFECANSEVLK